MNESSASRIVVLSDLHLAPPGEQCVFAAHEALVAMIDCLAATPATQPPQWLVLNGDVFDFLQIPGYDSLSLPLAPQRIKSILEALESEPAHRNIPRALRRFCDAGHVLSCLPGNHDPELNLATVQQVLAQRLGSRSANLPTDGYWRLKVAGRAVVGLHGHHDDPFNAIGAAQMRQAQGDGDETVALPPGSRLVCQVINTFRRAKTPEGVPRFPFIDRLPSDQAVVLAIMLLDPRLAGRRLVDALGISASALVRKALMTSGFSGSTLGGHAPESSTATQTPSWAGELIEHIAGGAEEEKTELHGQLTTIDHEVDAYFAGQGHGGLGQHDNLASGDSAMRRLLWRALGRALVATREKFRSGSLDQLARQVTGSWGREIIAITGHTHAAKSLVTEDGGTYLNTGTWLEQVFPPSDTSVVALREWLTKLQKDEVPIWNGQPVAVVDSAGARLLRWTKDGLAPWQDPLMRSNEADHSPASE